MKIFIVGSEKIFAIENFYREYLKSLGAEIVLFPAQDAFYDYYQKNIINKLIYRSGLSRIIRRINDDLLKEVSKEKPDILWVFKGMTVKPQTLKRIKNQSIKLVNYNPDSPFIFSGAGSGNSNVVQGLPYYDMHLTYSATIQDRLVKEYNVLTHILPFGFDVSDELVAECERLPEICKICFLGNPDSERANFIEQLANAGIAIDVYGHYWSRFIRHPFVTIHGPVYGDDQWRVLRRYRVQLNLMRKHNTDSHNMRTFEVPGIGGIMVAPDTPDHRQFFENGKEVFLFDSVESCVDQIKSILTLDVNAALNIRGAARMRSINSGYTYRDRTTQVWKEFQKLLDE